MRTALQSIFRENFRASLRDHFNPCRNYAFEDEGGLLIATYPEGTRQPMVAAPYAEEAWTGIEYASASHMIMHGLLDEGLDTFKSVSSGTPHYLSPEQAAGEPSGKPGDVYSLGLVLWMRA